MKTAQYRGYTGEYKYLPDHNIYFGKISNVHNLVTFEAANESEIQKAFQDAVDDYINLMLEHIVDTQ